MSKLPKGLLDYVKSVAEGRFNPEIAEMASNHFGVEITHKQIGWLKTRHGITSNVNRKVKLDSRLFTKEQVEFIENHQYDLSRKELADLLNQKFNLSITPKQIKNYCDKNKLTNKYSGRFVKGQESWCKGTKGVLKANSGSFKVGDGKELGSQRKTSSGSILIKISNKPHARHSNWRPKHELAWEEHHGQKVPKNHIVIFLDGDKTNFSIDNLALINKGELLKMNQYHYFNSDSNITSAGIGIIRLDKKIKQAEKLYKENRKKE